MGPSVGAAVGEVSMYGAQVVGTCREEEKRIMGGQSRR